MGRGFMEQLKTSSKRRSLEGGKEWGQDLLVTVSWNEIEPSYFQLPPPISPASTINPDDYTCTITLPLNSCKSRVQFYRWHN